MALLDVKELSVHFGDEKAPFKAVDRISYQVNQGEVLGIVGESGSGKSVSSLAVMEMCIRDRCMRGRLGLKVRLILALF